MTSFQAQLGWYKELIDADIAAYAAHVHATTRRDYGQYGALVNDAFLEMLERGGKRLRGTLVMVGYEMCSGKDRQMILRAATAIEMVNSAWLILDDIQDRSKLRRGKPTVHELLAAYHQNHHLEGDAAHTGMSLALNAAIGGGHAALLLLGGLQVEPDARSKAMSIVAQAIAVTAYGQTYDIMNELTPVVTLDDIEKVLELKTAYYTFLNPLCTGMVLAGADCADTDAIRGYAMPAGKAFQITDDIMGVFGTDTQTGKSAMDDMREGKQTLLTYYAFGHTGASDEKFLRACLGDETLTKVDFERCKQIMQDCGALAYAEAEAQIQIDAALSALAASGRNWSPPHVKFLENLAQSLAGRAR